MTDIMFGRLEDLPLREAWKHEAHQFTPWLAENIDHLSDAIGIPLELTATEVAVDRFSADIVARDTRNDSVVLIENQLEMSDRHHLGQIMTYVAGVEAETVVWIAPRFEDAHLAAVSWLNENTKDGFSFFAVRLRVVRIGDSPFAPIFEIVEKPNGWTRSLARQTEAAVSAITERRQGYWAMYLQRHPEAEAIGISNSGSSWQALEVIPGRLLIGQAFYNKGAVVYLRSPNKSANDQAYRLLQSCRNVLETQFETNFDEGADWLFHVSQSADMADSAQWPKAIDFQYETAQEFLKVLKREIPEASK